MSTNHDTKDIQQHIKVYMIVFATLAALTVATVAASYLDLSRGEAIFLALAIASIKGSLVASYFMHLISEKALITWILMLTAVFFFILMLFPMTSFIDQAQLG
ncbi:MAG: cytochrome C oxidase subunit IV family protein [Candidatus Marinimicrobia bacterium]|jgi:cytochrome c oxidase subunit 4|nr:cytochrome-c oxidase [Candidatus Neomarinimicrobiota bacterium]MDP6261346.1 cytochrome C oxidase subunit IV family protein [Candidatus Neomarinimicrobiota bacterium]MDP7128210.1 cytochrome C oxidase subunit IV family protein [Candidatus Neomarinimicrobiota bacterium]MDP7336940.1 cytochrome C oxidase subunit IV family protein [Candidatus Neomarinimicrobiota bacterium]MDP7474378.1 cytochrome C oxidase subunit IV family protein [Candidatus Neomarinimicrobiota bacterium]|tara:strand:- start:1069 stop:1377 length:309 start_codon:yes stop_codon:yes gene_type:complete